MTDNKSGYEIFEYKDGKLFWAVNRNSSTRVGDEAGFTTPEGYRRVRLNKRTHAAHRVIWEIFNGPIPDDLQIDHINGIRSDNRIENLRIVTARENSQNRVLHRNGRLVGCSWNKRKHKWYAHLQVGGTIAHLGYFDTEEKAHAAYCRATEMLKVCDYDLSGFKAMRIQQYLNNMAVLVKGTGESS